MRFIKRTPQQDAWLNILEGSVRSGKTWAMIPKLLQLNKYRVSGLRVILGVSKSSLYRNILSDLFRFLGPNNYRYNQQSGQLFINGVEWHVIGAADEGAQKKIQGMTAGIVYVDEATKIPESAWDMLLTRMSPAGARLYGTCNPDSPLHWLKKKFLNDPKKRANGDLWSEHFTLEDNMSLSKAKIDQLKRSFSGVFHQRYILGLWVIAEGVIYRDALEVDPFYDETTTPVGLFSDQGNGGRYIAVDYGTTNPCVFLDIWDGQGQARKTDLAYYCDREYYWDSKVENRQKTDMEYADDLERFIAGGRRPGHRPLGIIVDPSAASFRVELQNRGHNVIPAKNDVLDGIRKTASLMQQRKLMFNSRFCPRTIEEFQTYSWNDKKAKLGEEEPIKANDHGPDAGRYFVHTMVDEWRLAA